MKKARSTEELARLYKKGRLSLDAALERHLRNHGLWPISGDDFIAVELAVGFANLGVTDRIVALSGDRNLTIAQVIEAFKLGPFLEAKE